MWQPNRDAIRRLNTSTVLVFNASFVATHSCLSSSTPMKLSFFVPASLLTLASLALAEGEASDVLSLTAATFESALANEPLVLVEFFAPWSVPSIANRNPY